MEMACLPPDGRTHACLANVWVPIIRALRGRNAIDVQRGTEADIRDLQSNLEQLLARREVDISALQQVVRDARRAGQVASSPVMQRSLKRILALKRSRSSIIAHVQTLESQLDAIESSRFNSQLVQTLKASSATMRSMGLSANLTEADDALSSLADTLDTAGEISTALSVPLADTIAEDELEAELRAIMDVDEGGLEEIGPVITTAPLVSQQMDDRPGAARVPPDRSLMSIPEAGGGHDDGEREQLLE